MFKICSHLDQDLNADDISEEETGQGEIDYDHKEADNEPDTVDDLHNIDPSANFNKVDF